MIISFSLKNIRHTEGIYYTLIDSQISRDFLFKNNVGSNIDLADFIFKNIYEFYKYGKECPFVNLITYYKNRPAWMTDETIRKTIFYTQHNKILDKNMLMINQLDFTVLPSMAYTIPIPTNSQQTFNYSLNWTVSPITTTYDWRFVRGR